MSRFVHLKQANELDAAQVPELLIKAVNDFFTGALVLTTQDGQRVTFRFVGGAPVRSHSAFGRKSFLSSLAEHLPAEQIALAEAHAHDQQVDEFTAVEQLLLLPPLSLSRLLHESLQRELLLLTQSLETIHYQFGESHHYDQASASTQGIEPLQLISDALLDSPYLSRCRDLLLPSLRESLVLKGRALDPRLDMRSHLRQVVSSLRRQPDSLDTLRLKRVASEPALVAVVYALRATDCILVEEKRQPTRASFAPPSGGITAVRRASTSGVREISIPPDAAKPTTSPGSSTSNPRPAASVSPESQSSAPSSRAHTPSSRSAVPVDEHALEQNALDAWMRAMDNRSLAKKALKIAERSAARAPRNPTILYYYGCLLSLNANYLEAEVALRRVLNFEPDHSEARHELLKIEKLQKEPEKQSLLDRWVGRKG